MKSFKPIFRSFMRYFLILWIPLFTWTLYIQAAPPGSGGSVGETGYISLNGEWEMGFSRNYTRTVLVPGIHNDGAVIVNEVLWYKKEIELPEGNWKEATLQLNGARFQPRVFVNGELVGSRKGGMARLFFSLDHGEIRPGNTITLEIALESLANVPPSDASHIPETDQWRSNVSSSLWDDVVLHLHGEVSIQRIIPFIHYDDQKVNVRFDLNGPRRFRGKARLEILDEKGNVLIKSLHEISGIHDSIDFFTDNKMKSWSPSAPNLYKLRLTILDKKGRVTDQSVISLGVKSFEVIDKHFYLNGQPCFPRGATVVWHRWMRTEEGRELGYDTAWFTKNIIQRTRDLGGNYIRFHLGVPPERFLDLCDRYGMIVQYEWSFFHGAPASLESLLEQYRNWLDMAMCHPSVSLFHPYNETEGEQLKTVWEALNQLLVDYPPLVMEDRDVLHIHKYWWSLFENLGLYYDDAREFPKAIMVDEFGGNYLDEYGRMGGYTTVKETFLRFLGRTHNSEERLKFHARANASVAEYWRRIGAAGISPFCALGSKQDGNSWFLGPLKMGIPKPVWPALAAAFSPRSVSMELWDRNFTPGQNLNLPLYLFNDLSEEAILSVVISIEDEEEEVVYTKKLASPVPPFSKRIVHADLEMPLSTGDYMLYARLTNPPPGVKYPVVSSWDFRVFRAKVPENVKGTAIAVPENETELKQMLTRLNIATVPVTDRSARVLVTSLKSWNDLAKGDTVLSGMLQSEIFSGKSVVMLDVGDRTLGQGYPDEEGNLGPLQGVVRLTDPEVKSYNLFKGVSLKFTETAEPESHLHPPAKNRYLWNEMPDEYSRLWNGLRGGLIVPAADMEFSGLSREAFAAQWVLRGASEEMIKKGPCYAYDLQGFYEFSDRPGDREVQKKLRDKIDFLVKDAPALATAINPRSPIEITDLHNGYLEATSGIAQNYLPLASCGKNLTRTPVALVEFGKGKGTLLVSQLLTAGRLAEDFGEEGLYGIRYDEVAVQMVLNMISLSLKNSDEGN